MGVRARMMIEQPADVEVTLKVTMKASEWEKLRDQMEASWPASDLRYAITDALSKVRKVVYADDPPVE